MYAQRRHSTKRMVIIVFDPDLPRQSKWKGPIGMLFSEHLYVDLSHNHTDPKRLQELIRILPKTRAPRNAVANAFLAAKNTAVAKNGMRRPYITASPYITGSPTLVVHKAKQPVSLLPRTPETGGSAGNAKERVARLMDQAGMSQRPGEHLHEKLARLCASIGVDPDAPMHTRILRAEEELGI